MTSELNCYLSRFICGLECDSLINIGHRQLYIYRTQRNRCHISHVVLKQPLSRFLFEMLFDQKLVLRH
jgi:hypothetical protein